MTELLDVAVQQQPVGRLFRDGGEVVFRYLPGLDAGQFVSLTMPVRLRDYVHDRLHPVFEMHLPEGYLLSVIKRHFAKIVATDDFGLLLLLSANVRGRLHYQAAAEPSPSLTLDDLLHPRGSGLFDELVQRFALQSPLSGVQPKVLARVLDKATLKLEDYIVKAWGPEYPQLALNEYWCMRAVQQAGVPVPDFFLSDDGALFIMKRFDIRDDGRYLGFEDLCVLQARQRDDKYSGSYEQVARTLKLFLSPDRKAESMQHFFRMMVLNQRLQNGDAHLKNFGVLYENSANVWLAPAYDVVSTTAYIRNDMSALTLMGSRKWWAREHLLRFGVDACDLTMKQARQLYDECVDALRVTGAEIERGLADAPADQQDVLRHLHGLMLSS